MATRKNNKGEDYEETILTDALEDSTDHYVVVSQGDTSQDEADE